MSGSLISPRMPHRDSVQAALPIELRPSVPPAAVSLLAQAQSSLQEAEAERDPAPRFVAAYLSALRAAAAILAARGRPHRGRARPESVWVLLKTAAPELDSWAALFAANSARQAAAQAGATRHISDRAASDLLRYAAEFVALVQRAVQGRHRERAARCGAPSRTRRHRSS